MNKILLIHPPKVVWARVHSPIDDLVILVILVYLP